MSDKKVKPEYLISYNKTLGDIRNSYYYNFSSNLIDLRDKLNLDDKMRDDIYERANMFGNILYATCQVGDYPLPVGQSLGESHLLIHEELARVKYYKDIVIKVIKKFNCSHYSSLICASPYTCFILEEFNEDIRFHLAANILLISRKYNIPLEWYHNKTHESNLNNVVKNIALFGLPKMWNIANKLVGTLTDIELSKIIVERFPVANVETNVYADTVAFYVQNATIISDEIRKVFILMQEFKRRNYRVVLFHSQVGYQADTLSKVVDQDIYLPATFNKLATEKISKKRYRAFFYTANNIWSTYIIAAEIGDYNIALDVPCYGCDVYISGSGIHAHNYTNDAEQNINLHGLGSGMTVIVPNSIDHIKKVDTYSSLNYVLLPWDIEDITDNNMNRINEYVTKDSLLLFYCNTNLQDYIGRLEYININYKYIVIHTVGEYFSTYKSIDSVIFASARINLILDALYFRKPITLLFDTSNTYYDSLGYTLNDDINVVANIHNEKLCASFWEFCTNYLGMTDRKDKKEKVKPEI